MKKLYYSLPFIAVPLLFLIFDFLHKSQVIKMSAYIIGAALLILCAIFAILSPSTKRFDLIITTIMPIVLFCVMFIIGLFDKSDVGTRFHLYRAFDVSLQPICLLLYLLTALTSYIFSLQKIKRIIK